MGVGGGEHIPAGLPYPSPKLFEQLLRATLVKMMTICYYPDISSLEIPSMTGGGLPFPAGLSYPPPMIFMPPNSEKLRRHIGLGVSVRPYVCPSVHLSLTLWQLRNSRTIYARILKLYMWHVHEK